MPRPLLSVIVPTRNRATRLAGAIDALLAQTVDDIEILVVDDGSTDTTPEVTDGLARRDARVRVLRREVPGGAPSARNDGLDEATGRYVGFCDDDDRWLPAKAEQQVAFLERNPDAAGVSCWATVLDEATGVRATLRPPTTISFDDLLWFNFPGSFTYGLVRNDGTRLDPTMPSCQDWDFWLRCARRGPFGVVPEILATFTVHPDPRITSPASESAGRRLLVAGWGEHMSRTCLAYHRAHFDMRTGRGARHRAGVLRELARQRSLRAAAIVLTEFAACKVGERTGDPALNARILHRILDQPAFT